MHVPFSFLFLCLLAGCTIRDKATEPVAAPNPYRPFYDQIDEAALIVKEGDLVLRNGQEFSSQIIKNFNRTDKSYSHAGLVFFKNGYPYVYHIVPGDENPDQKLRSDSLKNFCNPRKNFGFAVYRYAIDSSERRSLKENIYNWYAKGVSFDSAFNLKTDDRMYCSEMIKKGLANATRNRITIGTTPTTKTEAQFFSTHLRLPLTYTTGLHVVALDNLFLHPACKAVKRFEFNAH
jgi:hypothetical protein